MVKINGWLLNGVDIKEYKKIMSKWKWGMNGEKWVENSEKLVWIGDKKVRNWRRMDDKRSNGDKLIKQSNKRKINEVYWEELHGKNNNNKKKK